MYIRWSYGHLSISMFYKLTSNCTKVSPIETEFRPITTIVIPKVTQHCPTHCSEIINLSTEKCYENSSPVHNVSKPLVFINDFEQLRGGLTG